MWVSKHTLIDAVAQLHQLRVEGGGRPLNGQDVNAERVEWERTHDAFFGTLQVERHVVNESRYRIRRLQQADLARRIPMVSTSWMPRFPSIHGITSPPFAPWKRKRLRAVTLLTTTRAMSQRRKCPSR
jgi:hypothetical protein